MRARPKILVGIALAGVIAGGATLLVAPVRAETTVDVGTNLVVNRAALIDANNSPTIDRNPRRPENLVVAHRVDRPRFSAFLEWSDDGGASWTPTVLPLPPEDDRPYAPDLAFASDGTLYVLYVNLQGTGNDPENLWLATSTDGGKTLAGPTKVAGPLTFQARIAVDDEGVVLATWMQVEAVGTLSVQGPTRIVATRSTDGGATFSQPAPISEARRQRVGAAVPVVDGRGNLVVVYEDFKGDRRDYENLEGPAWDQPFALVVTKSTDGGRSFSKGIELESGVVALRRFLVYLPELPSLAAGPDDTLYVAWTDGRHGDEDVFIRRSDDGGRTWRKAVRVNDNPIGDGTTQNLPAIAVTKAGRVDVVFLDRRSDQSDKMAEAYIATSSNQGDAFANVRVSSAPFDTTVGPVTAPYLGVDLGSRIGVSSAGSRAVAVWTDTRLGTVDTGRQDIASAVISVTEQRSGSRVPIVAASGVLGLAVLVAGIAVARRRGATPGVRVRPETG